jgi:hypothetical protein
MTMTRAVAAMAAVSGVLVAGCSQPDEKADTTPLPTTASPPYICDHIPLQAVQRMTGIQNPLSRGSFGLPSDGGYGNGWCRVYQPTEEESQVLEVILIPSGNPTRIDEELRNGAKRLPQVMPGADGYYFSTKEDDHAGAVATLIRQETTLIVNMQRGGEGRNHEADVIALMKLIAPKLVADAGTPSPSPSRGS